jgi:hypothetical protein
MCEMALSGPFYRFSSVDRFWFSDCRCPEGIAFQKAAFRRGNKSGRSMFNGSLLFVQCLLESLLSIRDVVAIPVGIDKDTGSVLGVAL